MSPTTIELDVRGLSCPMPLLKAKQRLNKMQAGEVLKVASTDPGSKRDFISFLKLSAHELIENTEEGGEFHFLIRCGSLPNDPALLKK